MSKRIGLVDFAGWQAVRDQFGEWRHLVVGRATGIKMPDKSVRIRTMDILQKLTGGDRRSIGHSNEVVQEVLAQPALFGELFAGMLADDPLVRMRAADAVEKISARQPGVLLPYKPQILGQVAQVDQQEVRWHVAQLLGRIEWDEHERAEVIDILDGYLKDKSKIVRTFAMQALADLSQQDAGLRPAVIEKIEGLVQSSSPAVQSRGRRLLAQLRREEKRNGQ